MECRVSREERQREVIKCRVECRKKDGKKVAMAGTFKGKANDEKMGVCIRYEQHMKNIYI